MESKWPPTGLVHVLGEATFEDDGDWAAQYIPHQPKRSEN